MSDKPNPLKTLMDGKAKQNTQSWVWFLIVAAVVAVLVVWVTHKHTGTSKPSSATVQFATPINSGNVFTPTIESFQNSVKGAQKTTDLLKDNLSQYQSANRAALKHQSEQTQSEIKALKAQLAQLKATLNARKIQGHDNLNPQTSNVSGAYQHYHTYGDEGGAPEDDEDAGFSGTSDNEAPTASQNPYGHLSSQTQIAVNGDDTLALTAQPKPVTPNHPYKNPNTYVPAGTHALGVLLQGADLVSDGYGEQNPKPILIRLVSEGTLPNHYQSHLKNCVITAAMTGDISSGRGDVRLERLSCVRPNGAIVDVSVEGTVATHAKEGIVGQIYSREGARLAGATASGVAAGVANGVANSYVNYSNSLYGPVGTVSGAHIWQYGLAQGGATGLNKLSDFMIHRANQIHPIIQVNGGKLVTVTFLQGFYFDSSKQAKTQTKTGQNPWVPAPHTGKGLPTAFDMVQSTLTGVNEQ